MANLITREAIKVKSATIQTMDLTYFKDTHILAAQLNFLKPKIGKDLYNVLLNQSRQYDTWTSGATFASGTFCVHSYQDEHDVSTYGYFTNISGTNTGEPQLTTADFSPVTFFGGGQVKYDNLYQNGIENALAFYALAQALPNLQYKTGGHGIMTDAPEFQEQAPLKRQIDYCYGMGDTFMEQAIDYICDNSSDYPEYCPEESKGANRAGIVTYWSNKQISKQRYNKNDDYIYYDENWNK